MSEEKGYHSPENYWKRVKMGAVMHIGGQYCEECDQPNTLNDKECIKCSAELPKSKYS